MAKKQNTNPTEFERVFDYLRADADWHFHLNGICGFIKYWCGYRTYAQNEFIRKVIDYCSNGGEDNYIDMWVLDTNENYPVYGGRDLPINYAKIIKYLTECEPEAWESCIKDANSRFEKYFYAVESMTNDSILNAIVDSFRQSIPIEYERSKLKNFYIKDGNEYHYKF